MEIKLSQRQFFSFTILELEIFFKRNKCWFPLSSFNICLNYNIFLYFKNVLYFFREIKLCYPLLNFVVSKPLSTMLALILHFLFSLIFWSFFVQVLLMGLPSFFFGGNPTIFFFFSFPRILCLLFCFCCPLCMCFHCPLCGCFGFLYGYCKLQYPSEATK